MNKDFATSPIAEGYFSKGDTREDYSLDSFSADKEGYVTIAVPTDTLDAAGWIKAFGTFNSTITNYSLYRYYYSEVGQWVQIPKTSGATPTLLFADKGCLKFDNPLPVSASTTSDLMDPDSWVLAKREDRNRTGNEADMIIDRDGAPVILPKGRSKIRLSSPAISVSERLEDRLQIPGYGSKYSAIYDPVSDKYWALTTYSPIKGTIRTGVALSSSSDLKTFKVERQVIQGKSSGFHGFNYPFMQIDGDDIIFVLRTAWENEMGQAQRWHDANMLTFHRIRDFRESGDANTVN